MATTITMPQLGESVHEGTVARWIKQIGERVERFEPLLEVNTDKVNAEVPSTTAGVLTQILVQEGETVSVGAAIAVVDEAAVPGAPVPAGGDSTGTPAPTAPAPAAPAPASVGAAEAASEIGAAVSAEPDGAATSSAATADYDAGANGHRDVQTRYSPAVRRLAKEHDLDLTVIRGTGLSGRVTRDDVLAFIAETPVANRAAAAQPSPAVPAQPSVAATAPSPTTQPAAQPAPAVVPVVAPVPAAAPTAPAPVPAPAAADGDQRQPLTPMRKSIAEHMLRSVQTSPHVWSIMEIDMHAVHQFRLAIGEEFKRREGFELTYLPFVVKAVTEALRKYPTLNAVWGGDHILVKRDLNIGIAVAIEPNGLLVPVIRNADSLSLTGIARAVRDLATRARSSKLQLADLQGGTFTVNNPGTFGTLMSTPIINQPQAAIFSMEGVHKRPVVIDDMIAIRPMMNAILAIDHRVNDGMVAARFLGAVRDWLQGYQAGTGL